MQQWFLNISLCYLKSALGHKPNGGKTKAGTSLYTALALLKVLQELVFLTAQQAPLGSS